MAEPADRDPPPVDETLPRGLEPLSPLADHALYGILAGNGMTLAAALTQHWSATPILWVYWCQSVIIGVVNVIRMLSLREFSTAGLMVNGRQVEETAAGKRAVAGFFALHYGFFHFVYLMFLMNRSAREDGPGPGQIAVLVNVAVFAIAHAYPLVVARGSDFTQRRPNLGTLMFYPYLRILPMHLTIILGAALPFGALPLFVGLKSAADLGMHLVEHRLFRGAA